MFRSKPEPEPVLGIAYEEALSVHIHDLEDLEEVGGIMSTRKNAAVVTLLAVLNENFFNKLFKELDNSVLDHANSLKDRHHDLLKEVRTDGSDRRVKKAKKDRKKLEKMYMKSKSDVEKNTADLDNVKNGMEQFQGNLSKYLRRIDKLKDRIGEAKAEAGGLNF